MMDIVERLRADADKWMAGEMDRDNEESGLLSHEAATEITRLRIALAAERERCAKIAEQWQCQACEVWFDPTIGHYDEDCAKGRASWDQPQRDIGAAIRNSGNLTYSLHVTAGGGTGGGGPAATKGN